MTDQYQYYSCLVPDALKLPSRTDSEDDDTSSPPPRPPKSLTERSFDIPARDYPSGQGHGYQGYRARDYGYTSPSTVRGISPSRLPEGDTQLCNDSDEEPPQVPARISAWQYQSDQMPEEYSRNRDYSNLSPIVSPKWNNSSPMSYNEHSPPLGQFSPSAGDRTPKMSPFDYNQSSHSDPSPAAPHLSPGLPDVSPRRHTIDNNFPMPLVLPNEKSPALPQRSPVSQQADKYSDTGAYENSPALPERSPRKPPIDRPSYEYPPSSPRHHEYHQVIWVIVFVCGVFCRGGAVYNLIQNEIDSSSPF